MAFSASILTAAMIVTIVTIVTTVARLILTFATPDTTRKTGIFVSIDTRFCETYHAKDDQRTARGDCRAAVREHRRLSV